LSCPLNNAATARVPDFISAGAVKCKQCGFVSAITDLDPQVGKYWIALKWGQLMNKDGTINEAGVTAYSVHFVDAKNRIVETIGEVKKVPGSSTCCVADLYSITIAGTLPAGFSKVMVTADFGIGMSLPMGALSAVLDDRTTGLATKVTGSFTIAVSDVALFKTSKIVNAALREAVADSLTGVTKDNVLITGVTAARRLAAKSEGRRLAAGNVKVDYVIALPDYTGPAITAGSITVATLKTAINARLTAKGITATATANPVVAPPATTTVGTAKAASGTERTAPMGFLAVVVGFAAVLGMFH